MQKTTKYARREYIDYVCDQEEVKDALVKWLKNFVAVPDGGTWNLDWNGYENKLQVTLQQRFETPEELTKIDAAIDKGMQDYGS